METEVHEGTIVETLNMCALWAARLTSDIPKAFVDAFPKGVTAKTATGLVRCAYFACLQSAMSKSTSTLNSALPLIPTLMRTIENCVKQASQVRHN